MRSLKNNNAKVCFFQETICQTDIQTKGWTTKHNLADSNHSRGVAIVFDNTLDFEIKNCHKTNDARVILVNATVQGIECTLCNIYAPTKPNQRVEFFKKLKHWIPRYTDYPEYLILGGDFNCAINDNDRTRDNNVDASRQELKALLKILDLVDAWYIKNDGPQYTFTNTTTGNKSRIDYFFVSNEVKYKTKFVHLKHAPIKDKHESILMGFRLKLNKKGKGYWKFNAKLLEIPEYKLLIKRIVLDINENYQHLDA